MDKIGLLFVFSIVGGLGFLVLLIFGLIMLRDERTAKRAGQTGTPADRNATGETKPSGLKLPPAVQSLFKPRLDRADPPDAHEVLRVLRDRLTGRLIVEIAGRRYTQAADLQDPSIQRGFLTTLQDLGSFAANTPAPASASIPPLSVSADPTPLESTSAHGVDGQSQPASPTQAMPPPTRAAPPPPPLAPLPASSTVRANTPPPLALPSMNPLKQMQVLRERARQPAPPPPKSIAEQIDEILQEKIAGTPYRQRGLHVGAGPQGHVLFQWDGLSYEAVDDLPDAEARSLIHSAIAEWERRQ